MPRSPSPPRAPRHRSRSPRRHRERERPQDTDRPRSRSRSPPRNYMSKKPKQLSIYKKSSSSYTHSERDGRRKDYDEPAESGKERMERRDRGEVPSRYGGTREAGVRNTMNLYPSAAGSGAGAGASVGSFKRTADPLDRLDVKKGSADEGGAGMIHPDRRQPPPASSSASGSAGGAGPPTRPPASAPTAASYARMIEVIANDRMGRKVRVKCSPTDTVGDLKRLIAAQTGTVASKIQLKKWYNIFKDNISLQDYEIHDGMSLEMY